MKLLKTLKGKIALGFVALVAVSGVALFALMPKEESYRNVVVEEFFGTVLISNAEKENEQAYEGVHLYSGDAVSVKEASGLTLTVDSDKHLFAHENTEFSMEAAGKEGSGRTTIHLTKGAVLSTLPNSLNEGETYEVSTPVSTMSVRGTEFLVRVYEGEGGKTYAMVEVYEGKVEVTLYSEEGTPMGISHTFYPGEGGVIRGDESTSEFVTGEGGNIAMQYEHEAVPETVLVEPDCVNEGLKVHICPVCGDTFGEEVISPAGHTEGEWMVLQEADCTQIGMEELRCTVCDAVIDTKEHEALGHTEGEWSVVTKATCIVPGEEEQTCSVCEAVIGTRSIGGAHTPGEWMTVTEPTCMVEGTKGRYCTVCDKVLETRSMDKLAHTPGEWTAVTAATCTADGGEHRTCLVCEEETDTRRVAALGHSMNGEWEEIIGVTCEEDGVEEQECSRCHLVISRNIKTEGHGWGYTKFTWVSGKNYLVDGECQTCGLTETFDGVEVRADGVYSYIEVNGIETWHSHGARYDHNLDEATGQWKETEKCEGWAAACGRQITRNVTITHKVDAVGADSLECSTVCSSCGDFDPHTLSRQGDNQYYCTQCKKTVDVQIARITNIFERLFQCRI